MPWTSGTTTSVVDLVDKFATYCTTNATLISTSRNWVQEYTRTDSTVGLEKIFRAPGNAGGKQIFSGLCGFITGKDGYLYVSGLVTYVQSKGFFSQPSSVYHMQDAYSVALFIPSGANKYWFFVSGQRAVIVVRSGALYQYAYLGFGTPASPDNQYPYVVSVSAKDLSGSAGNRYWGEDYYRQEWFTRGQGRGNKTDPAPVSSWVSRTFLCVGSYGWVPSKLRVNFPASFNTNLGPTSGNAFLYPAFACQCIRPAGTVNYDRYPNIENLPVFLDGVYFPTHFNAIQPESILTVSGVDHILFPQYSLYGMQSSICVRMD